MWDLPSLRYFYYFYITFIEGLQIISNTVLDYFIYYYFTNKITNYFKASSELVAFVVRSIEASVEQLAITKLSF